MRLRVVRYGTTEWRRLRSEGWVSIRDYRKSSFALWCVMAKAHG